MRSVVALVCAIAMLLCVPAWTQEIPRKDVEDRVFGWMKVYDFKAATAPMTVDHRVYSIAQLSVANTLPTGSSKATCRLADWAMSSAPCRKN